MLRARPAPDLVLATVLVVSLLAQPVQAGGSKPLAIVVNGQAQRIYIAKSTERYGAGKSDVLLFCSTRIDQGWAVTWGSPLYDHASALATDRQGNVYVAGGTKFAVRSTRTSGEVVSGPLDNGFLLKFSSMGSLIWAKTYGWSYHNVVFNDLVVDPTGDVLAVGYANRIPNPDLAEVEYECGFVVRCDAQGEPRWAYASHFSKHEHLNSADLDPGGTLHAAGQTTVGDEIGMLLLGVAPDGTLRYAQSWSQGLGDWAYTACVDADRLYVGGCSTMGRYPDPKLGDQLIHPDTDATLLCFGLGGDYQWGVSVGGPYGDGFEALAISSNRTVFALGYTTTRHAQGKVAGANHDALEVAITPQGEITGGSAYLDRENGDDSRSLCESVTGGARGTNGTVVVVGFLPTLQPTEDFYPSYVPEVSGYTPGGSIEELNGDWQQAACSAYAVDPQEYRLSPLDFTLAHESWEADGMHAAEAVFEDDTTPAPPAP